MVKPLFMDPADLVAAWQKAAARNSDMPATPKVKVCPLPPPRYLARQIFRSRAGAGLANPAVPALYLVRANSRIRKVGDFGMRECGSGAWGFDSGSRLQPGPLSSVSRRSVAANSVVSSCSDVLFGPGKKH